MRILLVAPGVSIHTNRFISMLLSIGHDVVLLDNNTPLVRDVSRYEHVSYPNPPRFFRYPIRGFYRLGHWLTRVRLQKIYNYVKPDVVHVHWADNRFYDIAMANLHPLVITCWGSDINSLFDDPGVNSEHRRRIAYSLAVADHITSDSREILERCQTLVGHTLSTSIFYFGINLNKFRPGYQTERQNWRKQYGIASKTPVFLSVRRPVRQMGHDYILRAFAGSTKTRSTQAVLVFMRFSVHDSEFVDELNRCAVELGVRNNILWIDGVEYDKLPLLYAAVDYVINYPVHDGLPVSFFEAAACKKPIITANLKAYADFLREGDFITVSPQNSEALSLAIEGVMSMQQEKLRNQIEHNYALVKRIAGEKECYQKLEQVYISLVNARNQ